MLNVLHIFNQYLNKTEQWAFQLMSNTPDCKQHIAAKIYLEHKPGEKIFDFMDNPLSKLEEEDQETDWKKNIIKKVFIRTSKKLSKSFNDRLSEYINEKDIQVLHAHFANMGWEMIHLKKTSGIPLVVSFYGWDYEMLPHVKPEWKGRYSELFEHVDLILTEGDHGVSTLIKMGCDPNKVKVQKLGIEKETISFAQRSKNKNELRLIQIASFTEKKGQLYTVTAFAEAIKTCPEIHLTLIGDSRDKDYKMKVVSKINEAGLGDKVTMKDFLPYAELSQELAKHHVFIHPSCYAENKNCEGGAPTIIFNAAGSGMPTIATTHCDIPSLVIDQKTGLLTEEKSVIGLVESISHFYKMDQEQYSEFAKAAYVHIDANYCIAENGVQLQAYYQSLISKPL